MPIPNYDEWANNLFAGGVLNWKNFSDKGIGPNDFQRELYAKIKDLYLTPGTHTELELYAVEDIVSEYAALYKQLYDTAVEFEYGKPGTLFTNMLASTDYMEAVDVILAQHAQALQELYDNWETAARKLAYTKTEYMINFGTPVEAGVGEAGHAYYAPELYAPYPGFAIANPTAVTNDFTLHRAFTFEKITQVTEETRTKIRSAILQFRMQGGSTHDLMQYLTGVIGIHPERGTYWSTIGELSGVTSKAENIFRTELMSVQNAAVLEAIESQKEKIPDLQKMWIATGDIRTRDTHLYAHGQVVGAYQLFDVGGFFASCPGDPTLPAEERCRCRCTTIPWRSEWGHPDDILGDLNREIEVEKARRELEKKNKIREKQANDGKPVSPLPSNKNLSGKPYDSNEYSPVLDQYRGFTQDEYWLKNPAERPEDYELHRATYEFISERDLNNIPLTMWHSKAEDVCDHMTNRGDAKHKIVSELTNRTNIRYDVVNEFVRQWAHTSNGSDMRSLSIQQTAARIFPEAQLSPWQQTAIDELKALRLSGSNSAKMFSLFEDGRGVLPEFRAMGFASASEVEEVLLRAMYDYTQEQFQAAGISEVILLRGQGIPRTIAENWERYDEVNVTFNSMSSWSAANETAEQFAFNESNRDTAAVVTAMRVPVERVIGTARTGFGCLNEYEFVLLGGGIEDTAVVVYVR